MSQVTFKKSAIATLCAGLISAPVFAEQIDDIETIEVWSTSVKSSSTGLLGEEIANKQADHLSDLLRTIPGVDVGGAHSLNQRITIRSMDDKDLKISIDGASQNSYMYHHMGNLQIHADILKSVDIEVGTNSVINGGLGGAVRFETKSAQELLKEGELFGARAQLSSGANGSTNYSATSYGLLQDNIDFLVYYNQVSRDDYEVGGGEILDFEGNLIEGTDGTVRGLAGELSDALVKIGYNIGNDHRLALSVETYVDEGDYSYRPDMGLATDLAMTNAIGSAYNMEVPLLWPTKFTRDTVTLAYHGHVGSDTELRATLFNNDSELFRDESGWGAAWGEYKTGTATNSGVNFIGVTSGRAFGVEHDITYGVDILKYDTNYETTAIATNEVKTSGESSTNVAFFVQDRVEVLDNLFVTPGVRYDSAELETTLVDNTFSQTSFALAAEYFITKDLVVKASTTQLFKDPEVSEVFVGAGLDGDVNQDIEAETGLNSEIAIAYQHHLASKVKLTTGATFFNTDIDNYIYDYAGANWEKDNIGDMAISGYELYVGITADNLTANISFSDAESELDAFDEYVEFHDGARLDRQQGDTISANVSYLVENYDVKLNWETLNVGDVSQGLDLNGAPVDNSKLAYTVHNVSASWKPQILPNVSFVFGVDNVFDEYYASHSSRTGLSFHPRFQVELPLTDYEPGRNVKATVTYSF